MIISVTCFAASSIVPGDLTGGKGNGVFIINLVCTAHTDGTFTSEVISSSDAGHEYWREGYFLVNAFAVNDATTYPGSGAVTITDETGRQLVGSSSYDAVTLTLSTSASGVAFATIEQVLKMDVTSKLTVAVSDTGNAANIFDLYLVMRRWAGN